MYDRNNSGNITSRTLKFLLRGLGDNVSEEEVDTKLKEMDEDGNGTIDFHEFLLYMLEKVNKQNLCEDIIEIFRIFDREDSGYLTNTDIKIITKGMLSEEAVDRFCQEADLEGEGEINYKLFLSKLLR